ncbi:MAG: response regulator, partial [Anaerolineales bacterium]|nr:response regulator [Anaerolineales bacterium]
VRINDVMRGELDIDSLSKKVITETAEYLNVQVGALYLAENTNRETILSLKSSYAYSKRKNLSNRFKLGEGLIGQAALEKQPIMVENVPEDYIKITSGLGETSPTAIIVIPIIYENRIKGVIELASLGAWTELQINYLDQVRTALAINLEAAQNREELAKALAQAQALSEELEAQQEELRATNEELEEQTQLLEQSQAKLEAQQEELEVTNEELEEKNQSLQRQKQEIDKARREIEAKAEELAITSKYKSDFLANMSHELRTPLNSVLLLAGILAENKEKNLNQEQVESANIIYSSGNDLLSLINEILDLSKIEAGQMDIHAEKIEIQELAEHTRSNFQHMADTKGLSLEVVLGKDAPAEITADRKRVNQILKNLLSNAIKFTNQGGIKVVFGCPKGGIDLSRSGLKPTEAIAIAVQDSGIGIPAEKQMIIFEAFQQLDGGTARAFGGTGLGLTISRELASLLGGEIQLESEVGKGSTFTLYLPVAFQPGDKSYRPSATKTKPEPIIKPPEREPVSAPRIDIAARTVLDDRGNLTKNDNLILVVEDDPVFAGLLLKQCHQKGFQCVTASTGEEGLELVTKINPMAVILDIKLPGIDGWTVLENLKNTPQTRHIPVHIMSVEDATLEALRKGAIGHLTKPVTREGLEEAFGKLEAVFSRKIKELLVVEDNKNLRMGVKKLFNDSDIHVDEAATGASAVEAIKTKLYDCIILDLGLPDMTGFELLQKLELEDHLFIPPIIVHTGKELTREEEAELSRYSDSIIIKGVKSEERLLDEVSLFLHRVVGNIPEKKRKMITSLYDSESLFKDKKVLVVDDDMRNVFALTRVMEEKGIHVLKAENGKKALNILDQDPDVDLVIMDIMMPVMDGYETMQQIRAQARFQKLPILALTAKAMKQDRELCIAAGASDYLPKPIDTTRLFSMMRIWLYR